MWSVDFGFTNPIVIQWWAEDPDGRLYLYRELYRDEDAWSRTTPEAMLALVEARGGEKRQPDPP